MDNDVIKLIPQGDSRVVRTGRCDCGTTIYKKDLATNAIEFMVHPKQGRPRYQTVKPGGNPSTVTITCPDCGTEHIVAHVAETIGVADNSALS